MIEEYVTKIKKIRKLKGDSVFLLNGVEINLHDKPMGKDMEKYKYEQAVSECKKWRSLIKTVIGRNITVLSKKDR